MRERLKTWWERHPTQALILACIAGLALFAALFKWNIDHVWQQFVDDYPPGTHRSAAPDTPHHVIPAGQPLPAPSEDGAPPPETKVTYAIGVGPWWGYVHYGADDRVIAITRAAR